jgi:hypothetical protein
MEMEVEASLVGDGKYSKEVFKRVPLKGEGRKKYKEVMLGLIRKG